MSTIRTIKTRIGSRPTLEGAGVHLKRAFGNEQGVNLDPFLLLDDFHSDDPNKYLKGFPWHPHRGIETITYMLHGTVEHKDSMGNSGVIASGDVQWMTAGSGIVHQEMPLGREDGVMRGLQLWANLPASHKMMPPRYREITREQIPTVTVADGVMVKVICGTVDNRTGPAQDVIIEPQYLDVDIPPNTTFTHFIPAGHTVFAYTLQGSGYFDPARDSTVEADTLVVFEDGDQVEISAADEGVRFLLISGKPIREPVAWYGPIVMNTQAELQTAFEEYQNGTFLKHKL